MSDSDGIEPDGCRILLESDSSSPNYLDALDVRIAIQAQSASGTIRYTPWLSEAPDGGWSSYASYGVDPDRFDLLLETREWPNQKINGLSVGIQFKDDNDGTPSFSEAVIDSGSVVSSGWATDDNDNGLNPNEIRVYLRAACVWTGSGNPCTLQPTGSPSAKPSLFPSS